MRLGIFSAVCIIGLMSICACEDDLKPHESPYPVIEGYVSSEGEAIVCFTFTASPGEGIDLSDKIVRWAKIIVSDGDRDAILIGGPNQDFFPPYRYYVNGLEVQPGENYTLTAFFRDYRIFATCKMLPPTSIKDIEFSPVAGNDTLRSAQVSFIAPDDTPAYYILTMRENLKAQALPCMMSAVVVYTPGDVINIVMMRPRTAGSGRDYEPHFVSGEEFYVSLCRVERAVYEFWQSYFDMILFSHIQFVGNSISLPGNVIGGYGVWSAQGVDTRHVIVP